MSSRPLSRINSLIGLGRSDQADFLPSAQGASDPTRPQTVLESTLRFGGSEEPPGTICGATDTTYFAVPSPPSVVASVFSAPSGTTGEAGPTGATGVAGAAPSS